MIYFEKPDNLRQLRGIQLIEKNKSWEKNMEEDLKETGAMDEVALDRAGRRFIINRLTSCRRDKKMFKD